MAENKQTTKNKTTDRTAYLTEKVKIKLIAYRDGKNKARYLGAGDKHWLVPRGVEVELPRYAVKVLERQREDFIYV